VRKKESGKKHHPMSVDGWISYLQGIQSTHENRRLAMMAFIFAVIAVITSIFIWDPSDSVLFIYAFISIIVVTCISWWYAEKKSKEASYAKILINEIIIGELQESKDIASRWLTLNKQHRRKKTH
jgi:hypothetical protein